MNKKQNSPASPNVFALPNQTTILFALIVVTLLGAIGLGSIGSSPIPVWPLALALLVLTCRAFLADPEKQMIHQELKPAGENLEKLKQAIVDLAQRIQLSPAPELLITSKKIDIRTFGTWRRQFLAMSCHEALGLQADLDDPERKPAVEARLIHELYHFKTGDYWQMGLAHDLLRQTFLLTGWAILFFTGLGFLLIVAGRDFLQLEPSEIAMQVEQATSIDKEVFLSFLPSQAELDELRDQASDVNLSLVINFVYTAFVPFVLIAAVLRIFFWPKLWRLRELYADAGVVNAQKRLHPLLSNISQMPLPYLQNYPGLVHQLAQDGKKGSTAQAWRERLRSLRKHHYDFVMRVQSILDPGQIYGSWMDTALLLGSLTLLLDILLASPLTLLRVSNWPMHFTTLVIFVTVSLNLVPVLAQGRSGWAFLGKVVAFVMGLRFAWVSFTLLLLVALLFLAPAVLDSLLQSAVAGTAGYAGYSDDLGFANLQGFVTEATALNLLQVFVIFLLLLLSLGIITLLIRRLLTWYHFPQAEKRLMQVAYGIIGVGTLGLFAILLPVTAVLLEPERLGNPWLISLTGGGAFVVIVSLFFFLRAHNRYSGRCPHCDTVIPGSYRIGRQCPECQELLHPWLIAEYEL